MAILRKTIEYAFYLFVFLLPWQTRWMWHIGELNSGYWEYGTFSLYGTDILLILLLLATGYWLLSLNSKQQTGERGEGIKEKTLEPRPYTLNPKSYSLDLLWWLIAGLELIAFLSIFWAQDKPLAFYSWLKILEGIALFWLVLKIKFNFTKFSLVFLGGALLQALLGMGQFLTQTTFSSKWLGMAWHEAAELGTFVVEAPGGRWLRSYGSLPHPNMLAGFLIAALIVFLGVYLAANSQLGTLNSNESKGVRGQSLVFLVVFCLLLASLFFTFSRLAWLTLLLAFLLFFISIFIVEKVKPYLLKTWRLLMIFLLIFLILSFIFPNLVSTRFVFKNRLEVKSVAERIEQQIQAAKLIQRHLLKGVGAGNYTLAIHHEINPDLKPWDYQPVHNVYLLVLSELGIMGLVFYLGILIFIILKTYKFWSPNINQENLTTENPKLWFPIFSSLILLLFLFGFFDHWLWSLHFGIMFFWLALGLWFKAFRMWIKCGQNQALDKNF